MAKYCLAQISLVIGASSSEFFDIFAIYIHTSWNVYCRSGGWERLKLEHRNPDGEVVLKARDVAFVRFQAPDLGKMRRFLADFGMLPVESDDPSILYMRGYGQSPFLHVTKLGPPRFAGFGLLANSRGELERLARKDGAAVEELAAPGGGYVVRLVDPDGVPVDVVAAQSATEPLPLQDSMPWNQGGRYSRREIRRVGKGPSHVLRLGHVVMSVTDFVKSERWYKERFGFLTSDEIRKPSGAPIGAFLRCDRGPQPADHHSLFLYQHDSGPGYIHAAFEVHDLDDLMTGNAHLKEQAAIHFWGIGRHLLGSQVFDYWRDPWGHDIEHWVDGDQLASTVPPGIANEDVLLEVQWGPHFPLDPRYNP